MCVVALAVNSHPDWKILLAGNRDEFHGRPSAPLARWGQKGKPLHHIIAGRDLESGGSWLGVSEQGRLAVVTNIRSDSPPAPGKASRGALVADYLTGSGAYSDLQTEQLDNFNSFHLITFDRAGSAQHFANRPAPTINRLGTGIHALSNAEYLAPYPRKERLSEQFADWLRGDAQDFKLLFGLLRSEKVAADVDLSNFINGEIYGTRCSTVIAIDNEGKGQIIERRFAAGGQATGESAFSFCWPR